MPAATTRTELLERSRREFDKLRALTRGLDARAALARDDGDVSIKDVIAHRAHWIDLYLGWRADGLRGVAPQIPAPGCKWSQLKSYNAKLRADQAGLGWPDALEMLDAAHGRLMAALEAESAQALYGGPMPGGANAWTAGRWAEAAGASHYRSAAKYIRARLRAAG